jgi:hypothetical protein
MRVFGEARLIGRMPGSVKCHADMPTIAASRAQRDFRTRRGGPGFGILCAGGAASL